MMRLNISLRVREGKRELSDASTAAISEKRTSGTDSDSAAPRAASEGSTAQWHQRDAAALRTSRWRKRQADNTVRQRTDETVPGVYKCGSCTSTTTILHALRLAMIILLTGAAAPSVAANFSNGADAPVETRTAAQSAAQSDAITERKRNVVYSYAWDGTRSARVDDGFLPSERADSKQKLKWIAQLLLLLVPVVLGLTLVLTSLRKDVISRRHVPYRQRGPQSVRDRGNIA